MRIPPIGQCKCGERNPLTLGTLEERGITTNFVGRKFTVCDILFINGEVDSDSKPPQAV